MQWLCTGTANHIRPVMPGSLTWGYIKLLGTDIVWEGLLSECKSANVIEKYTYRGPIIYIQSQASIEYNLEIGRSTFWGMIKLNNTTYL